MRQISMISLSVCGLFCVAGLPLVADAAKITYENAVLGDGAKVYYPLDEAAGSTTVSDLAGGNTASVSSGITLGVPSATWRLNTAAADNGSGAITIPHNGAFDVGSGAFTIEMWFDAATTNRGDLFTYKDGTDDFGIHSESQGANTVSYYHNGFLAEATNVSNNAWHYLAVTRTAAGNVSIYIDGQVDATGTDTGSISNTNIALIGANHDGSNNLAIPFDGSIDEFAFYQTALTAAQIESHFQLAAVPEPSSIVALCGLGGMGLLLAIRRRRKWSSAC